MFGEGAILDYANLNTNARCLMSLPGAKEQLWHVDGEHLYTSEPELECYGSTHQACRHRLSIIMNSLT